MSHSSGRYPGSTQSQELGKGHPGAGTRPWAGADAAPGTSLPSREPAVPGTISLTDPTIGAENNEQIHAYPVPEADAAEPVAFV